MEIELILKLWVLSIIIVYYGLSGFKDELKNIIWKIFVFPKPKSNIPDKPFFCTLCLTWWISLVYVIIIGKLSLMSVLTIAFISYLTPITESLMILVKDLLVKVINAVYDGLKL